MSSWSRRRQKGTGGSAILPFTAFNQAFKSKDECKYKLLLLKPTVEADSAWETHVVTNGSYPDS